MPTVCEFSGISIYINYNDHNPPHFHARYGDLEASYKINEAKPWRGKLPAKQDRAVRLWCKARQPELLRAWDNARQHHKPGKIPAL